MLLEHYEKAQNDKSLSEQARMNAKIAAADMKANIAKKAQETVTEKKKK